MVWKQTATKSFSAEYNKDPARSQYIASNSGTPVIEPSKFRHIPQIYDTLLVRILKGMELSGPEFGVSLYAFVIWMDDEYIHISLLYFLYDYNEFNWKLDKNYQEASSTTQWLQSPMK